MLLFDFINVVYLLVITICGGDYGTDHNGGWGDEAISVGGGVLRERSSARKCNGSRRLGCVFLSKEGNTCSPLIRQV